MDKQWQRQLKQQDHLEEIRDEERLYRLVQRSCPYFRSLLAGDETAEFCYNKGLRQVTLDDCINCKRREEEI